MFLVVGQGLCTSIAAAVTHPSTSRPATRRTLAATEGLAYYSVEVVAAIPWTAFASKSAPMACVTYGEIVRHLSPKFNSFFTL